MKMIRFVFLTLIAMVSVVSVRAEDDAVNFISQNAMFWLDAADETTMSKDANNNLASWQSKAGDGRSANAVSATLKPVYAPSSWGMPTVDFGAYGNGKDMTYTRFTNIRTVFEVIKIESNGGAFLLGDANSGKGAYNFHRGGAAYFATTYAKVSKVWNGLRQVVDFGSEAIPADGFQIICFTTTQSCCSDSLSRDRNKSAAGGERVSGRQLSEVILFPSVLGDADRELVTKHLIAKWRKIALETVLANAVLRYDASRRDYFTFDANNAVTGWKNLGSGGATYDGTVPSGSNKGSFAWQNDVPVLQMGAAGSKIDLAFPSINTIRTVFWAMDIQPAVLFWLGYVGSEIYDFHCLSGVYGTASYGLINGDTKIYTDSEPVLYTDEWPLGLHQYTMSLRANARANRLTTDRKLTERSGGRALSEIIVCTSAIESFSRSVVQDYLQAKWTNGKAWIDESDFVYRRTAASGAWNQPGAWTLDQDAEAAWADGNPAAFSVAGEVSVDADTRVGRLFFTQSIRILGTGTLTLADPTIFVAEGETVRISAPLTAGSNIIKRGKGRLVFTCEQPNVPGVTVEEGQFLEARPLTAVWTGDGDHSNVNDPANWSCTDANGDDLPGSAPTAEHTVVVSGTTTFTCPVGQTLAYKALSLVGTISLDADCDWRGLGSVTIPADVTIDIAGHRFYMADLKGTATSTITDTVGGGEFHLDLAEGVTLTNTTVVLAGKLKFVKEGAGHYCSSRAQTYSGGTYIAAGQVSIPPSPSSNATQYSPWAMKTFGTTPAGTQLLVGTNAVFETNGNVSMATYRLGLEEGASFKSSVNDMNKINTYGGWGTLALTGDAHIDLLATIYFGGADTVGNIQLNNHTFTVAFGEGVTGKSFQLQKTEISAGTLAVEGQGNWLALETGNNLRAANLRLSSALKVAAATDVTDYYANCDRDQNSGTAVLNVYGCFTPYTDYYYGCTLQNGATLDLRTRTGTWTTRGAFTTGANTVTFAENARITVLLDGREDLAFGMKVVDFTDPVAVSSQFVLSGEAAETYMVDRRDDGLYLEKVAKTAVWSGAAHDGDVMNRANWTCRDANGNVIPNGRPGTATAVTLDGDIAFNAPTGSLFCCASLTIGSVVLTNDCDWAGLPEFVSAQCIDLHGHNLTICPKTYTYFGSGVLITDTLPTGAGGELHIFLPAGMAMSTDRNYGNYFVLTGSLKLVKDGEGTLTILGKNTYTGGTVINGGTLQAYNDTTATNYALCYYHDFGAGGSTVTVNSNATFDVRSVYEVAQHHVVLNGGTFTSSLVNKGAGMSSYNNGAIGAMTLTADSKIVIPGSGNHLLFNKPPYYGNLGGHTLTVDVGGGSGNYFTCKDYAFTNGTINIISGGWFRPSGQAMVWKDTDITCGACLYLDGDITVRDFAVRSNLAANASKAGTHQIFISGRYTPSSAYVHNLTLVNGATLNLGTVSALPWTWLPLGTEAGAVYNVELPRDPEPKSGTCVVTWDAETPPANLNQLKFKPLTSTPKSLIVEGTGLYLRGGVLILLR